MTRTQSPVSRTHDKLGAALAELKIPHVVRGMRALDVTGSTPGFAAVLLERGVAHVAQLTVGPTPLPPHLRDDGRVDFYDRALLKTLPATAVPGPFMFFLVDLRFASARTALRAVAFRLAEGANGIVWVKPRFEVPADQVKSGGLGGDALRDHALDQFHDKAVALGFEWVAYTGVKEGQDGEEVAVHLVYRGRPK